MATSVRIVLLRPQMRMHFCACSVVAVLPVPMAQIGS